MAIRRERRSQTSVQGSRFSTQADGVDAVPRAVNTIRTVAPGAMAVRPRTKGVVPPRTTVAPLTAVTVAFGILKARAHAATGWRPLLAMVAVALKPPGARDATRKATTRPSGRSPRLARSPGPR
ncbi:hypothetical protein LUW74_00670 [Actinomadura madurae]|uniref:hypothetical protein n=1 Tax=Actinomadura madurae TaxID=1993 RepID=UPI002026CA05|nr:hypothetical protein [Actinomadura madurae]URN02037.1 hypothetical protein LUW74_00670 [Actinomadura madurae]